MFAPPANDDGDSLTTEESRGRSGVPGEGVDGKNDRLIDRVVDPISWLMNFASAKTGTGPWKTPARIINSFNFVPPFRLKPGTK